MFLVIDKDKVMEFEMVEAVRQHLGVDGIKKLRNIYKEHGKISIIERRDNYLHSIHFNEGMHVRNCMRRFLHSKGIDYWTANDYDVKWEKITLLACRVFELDLKD